MKKNEKIPQLRGLRHFRPGCSRIAPAGCLRVTPQVAYGWRPGCPRTTALRAHENRRRPGGVNKYLAYRSLCVTTSQQSMFAVPVEKMFTHKFAVTKDHVKRVDSQLPKPDDRGKTLCLLTLANYYQSPTTSDFNTSFAVANADLRCTLSKHLMNTHQFHVLYTCDPSNRSRNNY